MKVSPISRGWTARTYLRPTENNHTTKNENTVEIEKTDNIVIKDNTNVVVNQTYGANGKIK